jgi:parallel beta-helix repeat protein
LHGGADENVVLKSYDERRRSSSGVTTASGLFLSVLLVGQLAWGRAIRRVKEIVMRRVLVAGASAVAVLLVPTAFATDAAASPAVVCGQTVTHDVSLSHDLLNCPGDGLEVGANHITIDLDGHVIDGVNAAGSVGINDNGHSDVMVKNGSVRDFFDYGVALQSAPHSSAQNLAVTRIGAGGVAGDASAGILVQNSPWSTVTANTVSNDVSAYQSDGVDVLSSAHAVVTDNTLARNAWDGMFVLGSPDSTIDDNQLNSNVNNGVEINSGSDGVVLMGNHAHKNVGDGIVAGAISQARITGNTLTGNGDTGLFLFDLLNSVVSGNCLTGNGIGLDLAFGQNGSTGITISHNNASDNVVGIVVDHASHNVVADNVTNANTGAPGEGGGVIVLGATDNTLTGNVATHNLGVGIGVLDDVPGDSAGNRLGHNVANDNAAHGIDVVAGTINGGGNSAHHNTPLPNCVGITCI